VVEGYISLAEARAGQADLLEQAIPRIGDQVRRARQAGALSGPGPIFLGIGASFAASAGAVWTLRSRGIDSWRLNAGEYPVPFPVSDHPIVMSQLADALFPNTPDAMEPLSRCAFCRAPLPAWARIGPQDYSG